MRKLVMFGDSVVFGQHVAPHLTFAGLLSKQLYPDCRVIVSARNGDTTRQALERMPQDVQVHRAEDVYIQFGHNDANVWQTDGGLPRVSWSAFVANLCEMLQRARTFGAQRILLATNHLTTKPQNRERIAKYNTYIRNMAFAEYTAEQDVLLVDMEHVISEADECGEGEVLLPDGVHLTELGHRLYFDAIKEILCPMPK